MSEKTNRCQSILLSLLFYRLTLGVYQQVSWKSFRKTKIVKKRYGIFSASGLGWPCRATNQAFHTRCCSWIIRIFSIDVKTKRGRKLYRSFRYSMVLIRHVLFPIIGSLCVACSVHDFLIDKCSHLRKSKNIREGEDRT